MKIDTSKIDGYDSMSAEDKVKALTGFEYEVPADRSDEIEKQKNLIDQYSSQIAAYKKKEKEGMDETARKEAEMTEAFNDLQSKYDVLLKNSSIDRLTAQYIGMGYPEDLAKNKAEAWTNNDTEKVIEAEKKYRDLIEKQIKADIIKSTPGPDDKGAAKKELTRGSFMKMSPQERFQFSKEHPDDYKKLYGGK